MSVNNHYDTSSSYFLVDCHLSNELSLQADMFLVIPNSKQSGLSTHYDGIVSCCLRLQIGTYRYIYLYVIKIYL
jgi:hypothetical protein